MVKVKRKTTMGIAVALAAEALSTVIAFSPSAASGLSPRAAMRSPHGWPWGFPGESG
jgi:hypothetical protein